MTSKLKFQNKTETFELSYKNKVSYLIKTKSILNLPELRILLIWNRSILYQKNNLTMKINIKQQYLNWELTTILFINLYEFYNNRDRQEENKEFCYYKCS